MAPSKDDLNRTRWTRGRTNFYETYYVMWNDIEAGHAGWVRYTLYHSSSGRPESAVWGVFVDHGHPERSVALKVVHPLHAVRTNVEPFRFEVAGSGLTSTEAWGHVASDDRQMAWRLRTAEEGPAILPFPPLLYRTPVPTTKFLAPSGWYAVQGTVTVNGETIAVRRGKAQQAHFWGTKQVAAWTWGNCALFDGAPDFAFEGVVGYLKRGLAPLTLLTFRYRGETYACTSMVQRLVTNRTAHTMGGWTFQARQGNLRFKGRMTATPEEMIVYQHVDPDGAERYSHNDLNATLVVTVERRGPQGWAIEDTFTATRAAKFEVAQPVLDPRARAHIKIVEADPTLQDSAQSHSNRAEG